MGNSLTNSFFYYETESEKNQINNDLDNTNDVQN